MSAQNGIAYGAPPEPAAVTAAKSPRILKAHLDAAEAAIPDATAALATGGTRAFAAVMAEAVVGAEDWVTTRYVVGVRAGSGVGIYGPYATAEAAAKVATSDAVSALAPADPITGMATVRAAVWPLLATPKAPKRKPLKKKKEQDA